ncbi:MAG: GNAT family N-acetyltransferase [Calditrichaeota bacterium]|nr:MAG: GNAT family N-acetyltransferase [Calditrichota bacterium]MBL1204884.1 GNAT family N-acetyltransferase [Calditrichota bacterium]NOG44713.1 GNAT family N-acetyltransferase [Calditrichota bacterium]
MQREKTLEWPIQIIPANNLKKQDQEEVFELCERAFGEDLRIYFQAFINPLHFIVWDKGVIVGHACIIERWLQVAENKAMRTAYIEAVATDPKYQKMGIGTALMKETIKVAKSDLFEIGGLCPDPVDFYLKLGWQLWKGPLNYRKDGRLYESPKDEQAMIYRLPKTPQLDIKRPLSIEWRSGPEVW